MEHLRRAHYDLEEIKLLLGDPSTRVITRNTFEAASSEEVSMMLDYCPICGHREIIDEVVTEVFKYKGHQIPIENYHVHTCKRCGEGTVDPQSRKRAEPVLRDAQRTIDGFLTSKEMKAIRKSFGMTQDEFSQILGGGEKAFARYETGKVLQSKPMDNLLRILRAFPNALDIIRPGADSIPSDQTVQYESHVAEGSV